MAGYQITINGQELPSLDQCVVGNVLTAGLYYALEPYGQPPRIGNWVYDDQEVTFTQVDGTGIKRGGKRKRFIAIDVVCIANDKANAEAFIEPYFFLCSQLSRYTITFPGGTAFQGCRLVQPESSATITNWQTLGTKVLAVLRCSFVQLSDTN